MKALTIVHEDRNPAPQTDEKLVAFPMGVFSPNLATGHIEDGEESSDREGQKRLQFADHERTAHVFDPRQAM